MKIFPEICFSFPEFVSLSKLDIYKGKQGFNKISSLQKQKEKEKGRYGKKKKNEKG